MRCSGTDLARSVTVESNGARHPTNQHSSPPCITRYLVCFSETGLLGVEGPGWGGCWFRFVLTVEVKVMLPV